MSGLEVYNPYRVIQFGTVDAPATTVQLTGKELATRVFIVGAAILFFGLYKYTEAVILLKLSILAGTIFLVMYLLPRQRIQPAILAAAPPIPFPLEPLPSSSQNRERQRAMSLQVRPIPPPRPKATRSWRLDAVRTVMKEESPIITQLPPVRSGTPVTPLRVMNPQEPLLKRSTSSSTNTFPSGQALVSTTELPQSTSSATTQPATSVLQLPQQEVMLVQHVPHRPGLGHRRIASHW